MSSLDFTCPTCDAPPGVPCRKRNKRWGEWGTPTKRPHGTRSALSPKPVVECGTYAGYQQHGRRGEPRCEACSEANREYARKRRAANAEGYVREKRYSKAQTRALWVLADCHRDEFRQLVEAELQRLEREDA